VIGPLHTLKQGGAELSPRLRASLSQPSLATLSDTNSHQLWGRQPMPGCRCHTPAHHGAWSQLARRNVTRRRTRGRAILTAAADTEPRREGGVLLLPELSQRDISDRTELIMKASAAPSCASAATPMWGYFGLFRSIGAIVNRSRENDNDSSWSSREPNSVQKKGRTTASRLRARSLKDDLMTDAADTHQCETRRFENQIRYNRNQCDSQQTVAGKNQ